MVSHGNKRSILRFSFVAILMVASGSFMFSLGLLSGQHMGPSFNSLAKEIQRKDAPIMLPQFSVQDEHPPQSQTHSGDQAKRVQPPILRKGVIGNYEPKKQPLRHALGEYGVPVELNEAEKADYQKALKNYGFNMVISDRISLDRNVPDIRDPECRFWHYPENLPRASVVVVFHNEGWSTLMRTIHSIFNASPAHLLQQVVMVDDFSEKEHLKSKLEEYIQLPRFLGKIKLVRTREREGLIRARIIGAENSDAEVVVFLDAHCECGINWLPPLLAEIAVNRTTVVCPTVDSVEADTFQYGPQGDGLCRGAFDWEFWYKRIPVKYSKEITRRQYMSEPYYSPVMAGGLFAIDRSYFFQIGGYDPGMEIWGGENFEISFKIWMCGGKLLFLPCSRVGHIYRKGVPYKYKDLGTGVSVVHHNYIRVAEVWLDEYKEYFYSIKPDLRGKPHGDISAQVKYRRDNCPYSFKWFMEEIAYDLIEHYPPPPLNIAWGEVRAVISDTCMDTMSRHDDGGIMGIGRCHGMGGNQLFRMDEAGRLLFNDVCLYFDQERHIRTQKCNRKGLNEKSVKIWKYDSASQRIFAPKSDMCLDHNNQQYSIFVSPCDNKSKSQAFQISPTRS
ncbi:N-acetylgalactosaminyltransferase 7-like [Anneissia japonica]|uniref:N-acetylgalactosaminyltransferase 7-like n=1 Tax=Anneissia japonica TaxID=1529436 RepID=UPI0014256323|nr:N-acetylgalactosaminyltransferase 7-like [Anneissia japonica]XP_033116254.1 N-acetylgalactosaminyltransferase 7-like [Anneissia japonica]